MIPPAADWQRKVKGVGGSGFTVPLLGLAIILLALASAELWLPAVAADTARRFFYPLLAGAGLLLLVLLAVAVRHNLFVPLAHLRNWAMRVRGGNLAARIPEKGHGEFTLLAADINALSHTLQELTRHMEDQVRKQTERIAQKNRSLKILYDVAASINGARDLDELLSRFLHMLRDVTNARAGTVRLLTDDGQMRIVASVGLDEGFLENERLVPVERCHCGSAILQGVTVCTSTVRGCEKYLDRPLFADGDAELLAVPLAYRGRKLGVYNLFVDRARPAGEDMHELLTSIGQHLGMAVEKARLDNEAQRLSILEERTLLAHELHDSLAQCLASLRFQISTLEESLPEQGAVATSGLRQLRNGIEEANTELRELLGHFRAPMDERGLVPSLESVIGRFRKSTGIAVFFQNEWRHTELPANCELQILRIVQEALCNIRKHSQARTVRILLRHAGPTDYHLLVEDDGVGLSAVGETDGDPLSGEHIGLAVMRERAQRLGGELSIESEAGEGTRLLLTFHYPGHNEAEPPVVRQPMP